MVSAGRGAAIKDLAASGDAVWLVADGDDAFVGITEGFTATGMICRLDDLGR